MTEKELECNVLYDKEVGPVTVKCKPLTTLKVPAGIKEGTPIVIMQEDSEEFGTRYSIWNKSDYDKFVKDYEERV